MDEFQEIDQEAVDALIKFCNSAENKKEIKKLKPYERQFLQQYLNPRSRESIGDTEYDEER